MSFHKLFYSTVLLCVSLRQRNEQGKTLFAVPVSSSCKED